LDILGEVAEEEGDELELLVSLTGLQSMRVTWAIREMG